MFIHSACLQFSEVGYKNLLSRIVGKLTRLLDTGENKSSLCVVVLWLPWKWADSGNEVP